MENKHFHMDMIQGIINRMANNSFMLKGWAVTLIAGIFVLASKDTDKMYFLIAYIPIILFWLLDSYYLNLERLYRKLYDKVCGLDNDEVNYSMSVSEFKQSHSYFNCLFSATEIGFYLPLAVLSAVIIIITNL